MIYDIASILMIFFLSSFSIYNINTALWLHTNVKHTRRRRRATTSASHTSRKNYGQDQQHSLPQPKHIHSLPPKSKDQIHVEIRWMHCTYRSQQTRLIQVLHKIPHRKEQLHALTVARAAKRMPSHEQTQLLVSQKYRKELVNFLLLLVIC